MGDNGRNSSDRKNKRQQRCNNILVVLRCLICFAFGVNVYLSITHDTDTDTGNNSSIKQQFNSKNNRNSKSTINTKSGISLSQPPATTTTISEMTIIQKEKKIQKKIHLLLSDPEIEWIQTRSQIFNTSIDFNKLRNFYVKAQHDPLSRSGHPDHNYAIDSSAASSATTTNLLHGSSDDSVNNSNISSSNNNNFNNNNEVIINKVNGNPGIALGDGPWLDFMIAGNPKCGTTTLMANLQRIAPMRIIDFCVGVTQTLRNSYIEWPSNPTYTKEVRMNMGGNSTNNNWLRGSKCPRFLNQNFLLGFGALLPKTKLIIGIRHPIDWYTSFWNMAGNSPKSLLENIEICPCPVNPLTGIRPKKCPDLYPNESCSGECRCGSTLCLHRSRLHLPLARLGKTTLSKEERQWLAPNDDDGGMNLFNANITNPIFLYDMKQMKSDAGFWNDIASFLGVSHIPNEEYRGSHGLRDREQLNMCGSVHDYLRSLIMKYSYELSMWLQLYFIPQTATNRNDVTIAGGFNNTNTNSFRKIIESYKYDPCERLIRRDSDGIYVLKKELRSSDNKGDDEEVSVGMDTTIPKQCGAKTEGRI